MNKVQNCNYGNTLYWSSLLSFALEPCAGARAEQKQVGGFDHAQRIG